MNVVSIQFKSFLHLGSLWFEKSQVMSKQSKKGLCFINKQTKNNQNPRLSFLEREPFDKKKTLVFFFCLQSKNDLN